MSEVQRNPSVEGSLLSAAEKGEDLGLSYVIARNIFRIFSVFAIVFLRSRLGERYLTSFHVAGSLILAGVFLFGAFLVAAPWSNHGQGGFGTALALFLAYTAALACRYGGVLYRRLRNDFSVHSRSDGNPWPLYRWLGVPFPLVGLLIEPVLVFGIGLVLSDALDSMGARLFFCLGAIGHFIEQQLIAQAVRDKLLDIADAHHEQQEYEAMAHRVAGGQRYAPETSQSPFLARLPSSLESQRYFARALGIGREAQVLPLAQPQPTGGK